MLSRNVPRTPTGIRTSSSAGGDGMAASVGVNRLLTVRQIVERTGWSRAFVYSLLGRGLPVVRVGRTVRVLESDLEAFIRANRRGGQA